MSDFIARYQDQLSGRLAGFTINKLLPTAALKKNFAVRGRESYGSKWTGREACPTM